MTCDISKLFVMLAIIGSALYLGALGQIEGQAVVGLLSACLGYVFGNGHALLEYVKTQGGGPLG